jgi:hypothetical protein
LEGENGEHPHKPRLALRFDRRSFGRLRLLIRDVTDDSAAAFVGGLIFAFSPVIMAHASAGHLDYVSAEGIPFFLLFLGRATRGRRWTDAVWAGLALAYAGLSNWTYLLFLAVFLALHLAYYGIVSARAHLRWPVVRQYVIISLVALLGCAPFLIPAMGASRTGTYDLSRYVGGSALYVSDVLGFLTPSPDHALFGDLVTPLFGRFTAGRFEGTVYLGVSALVLAIVGFRSADRTRRRLWLIVALVFAILSLGPGLHVLGRYQYPSLAWMRTGSVAQRLGVPMRREWVRTFDAAPMIPLPGALLQVLPVFKWLRAPSRFVVMVMMALAVLASHGIAQVRQTLSGRHWLFLPAPAVATVLIGVVVLFEYAMLPFPTTPVSRHPFHEELARQAGEFGVLELPIEPFQVRPQYWQTGHEQRLAYGHISRVAEDRFEQLARLEQEVRRPTGYFEQVGIRFLVLHEDRLMTLSAADSDALVAALNEHFEPVWETEGAAAYCAYADCLAQGEP